MFRAGFRAGGCTFPGCYALTRHVARSVFPVSIPSESLDFERARIRLFQNRSPKGGNIRRKLIATRPKATSIQQERTCRRFHAAARTIQETNQTVMAVVVTPERAPVGV